MFNLFNAMKQSIGAMDNGADAKVASKVFDNDVKNFTRNADVQLLALDMFSAICKVQRQTKDFNTACLAMYILAKPHAATFITAKYPEAGRVAERMKEAYREVAYHAKDASLVNDALEALQLKLIASTNGDYKEELGKFVEDAKKEFEAKVMDVAEKIADAKKKEEEKLHQDVIEATATPVEEDPNAVAAYLPEGKEIVKRGRNKPKAKENNIKDAEIVEENFKVAKMVEPPKATPLGSAAQPTQATVPPVPMPEKKRYFDKVTQPDVFKVTLDPNNPSITFIPAEQQQQPQPQQQAAPIAQPPVQQVQSDMPNLNNLIQPEEPVKDQKTFMGPKVKIVEDKPVEEFGLKPDVKVTTPPSQQIIDPPMPQPVNPQYASIPNMGNFKVVPPETNVNTGINNPILLFKENIGEVGFILTFGQYIVPKEIFTRLDYSNLVNTQFDCGIILCDITSIFGNPETYRMIKEITKNDYLPMFRYVGNNPSGRAVFYSEQVNGKTVRIEVVENNGTANISVKAI